MDDDDQQPEYKLAIPPLVVGGLLLLLGVVLLFGWTDLVDWSALAREGRRYASWLSVFAAATIFLGVGVYRWRRPQRWPRHRAKGLMTWWAVTAAAVVVGIVAWIATTWLLKEADAATDRGAARVDAIKTGLGIGAGTTGVFALLLAVRRQTHQERTAADISWDAAEKRVTELYTKASDQLGSDKAAVRLAGLYSLERLAQDNPKHRQTIINVLCAYLRMPFDFPQDLSDEETGKDERQEHREQAQELQVRITAQKLLSDHLDTRIYNDYWGSTILDLSGAHLHDFALANCHLGAGYFDSATFSGHAWFENLTCLGGPVLFDGADFDGSADFDGASFPKRTSFGNASFRIRPTFEGATFAAAPTLARVTVQGSLISRPTELGIVYTGDVFADYDED